MITLFHQRISSDFLKKAAQKKLILVRGPSGSGKSHLARELATKHGVPEGDIHSTDKYFTNPDTGEYQFQSYLAPEYHWYTQSEVEADMYHKKPVILVDNTNTQKWQMKPYVELAQKYGYEVEFAEPNWGNIRTPEGKWNADELIKNQSTGNRLKQHKVVPDDRVQQMVEEYEYDPTVEEILQSSRPVRESKL
jgi:NEDD4-binding protein 2